MDHAHYERERHEEALGIPCRAPYRPRPMRGESEPSLSGATRISQCPGSSMSPVAEAEVAANPGFRYRVRHALPPLVSEPGRRLRRAPRQESRRGPSLAPLPLRDVRACLL